MSRFLAIPVAQGDAFYLETTEGSVLVDGGRSASGFPDLFRTYTKRDGVDILVATHNDADHANGILGFLRAGLRCREVWLPGRWAQVLPEVLRPWEEVVALLAEQVDKVAYEFDSGTPALEQYADFQAQLQAQRLDKAPKNTKPLQLNKSGWPLALISQLEEAYEDDDFGALPWWEYWLQQRRFYPPYAPKRRLFLEAIVAAKRIRQIALEAYHLGIPVRWFEFDPASPGGGYGWLEPINSRRIARVIPVPAAAFFYALALTVWNKESLVLSASPPYAGAGILFTSDSDLKDVQLPVIDGAIVTAPHHGSEANKNVYGLINARVTWVRSDGRFRKRPCPEYLQAQGKRFCTLCREAPNSKQAVILWQRFGKWVRSKGVRTCVCR
jgi:hypothetical protein